MPCRPTDTLQLPLSPIFLGKARELMSLPPTWEVRSNHSSFLTIIRVAVTAVCQWVLTRKHQQELLEAETKTRAFYRCRRLCPALLCHCHGLILVLYSECVPPFPAMSICQAQLASGWKKFFGWNWQILLTQFTSPLSRQVTNFSL